METPAGTLQPSLCLCLASCLASTLPGKSCDTHTCCCPRQSPRPPRRGRASFVVPQLFPDGHRPAHSSHACALPLAVIPDPPVYVAILLAFWYVRTIFCPVPAFGRPLTPIEGDVCVHEVTLAEPLIALPIPFAIHAVCVLEARACPGHAPCECPCRAPCRPQTPRVAPSYFAPSAHV